MRISAIGELTADPRIPGWLTSRPVPVPFFDGATLSFTLVDLDEKDEGEATAAIAAFLKLGRKDRLAASPYVHAYYRSIRDAIGEDEVECRIDAEADVWNHVQPSQIYVSRRDRRDRAIYVQIEAECDWEAEHGLQIVYRRGGVLSRVSDVDGHLTHTDAYDLPEDQDRII